MKILFVSLSGVKFDVETPRKQPLGGTESACAYLAEHLAVLGHCVTIMSQCEKKKLRGVWHVPVARDIDTLEPDVVIVLSGPQAIPAMREIVPKAKIVLWNHMQPNQPTMQTLFSPDVQKTIEHIVYVSASQKAAFSAVPASIDACVINNAIGPAFENAFASAAELLETKLCKGIYTSTPYRGLAILSGVKEIPIDVYSSMQVYQGDDAPYKTMYDNLEKNDCLTLHGSVAQEELARVMRDVAFYVYPSIFPECHSIAIIEAMALGVKIVTTDMAAAPYEFVDSIPYAGCTVADYAKLLRKNINYFRAEPEKHAQRMWEQVQYINREFTWKTKAIDWDLYLRNLLNEKSTTT